MAGKYLRYIRQYWKKTRFYSIIFILLIILDLISINILLQYGSQLTPLNTSSLSPPNSTLWVTGDGNGNFTCDGNNDQVEINQAFAYVAENPQFTTVHLKGPNTYLISDTIFIGNNTTLEGDPTAVIKLVDSANWPVGKPLITQMNRTEVHGITIKGFEINGNHDNNQDKPKGYGYYNMIHFRNATYIRIYDMYMHDGHGEGMKVDDGYNVQFYNNTIYKTGHNGLFAENSQYIEAWNNTITVRTDSGLRIRNSNHVRLHDNKIESFYHWSAGASGILIEKTTAIVDDIEVYNNTIQKTYGPGIWLIGCCQHYSRNEAENVHIFRNIFYKTGTAPSFDWVGGIVTSGFYDTLIENNTFDGVYHGAIIQMYPKGGTHIYPTYNNSGHIDLSPKDTGYTTIVRNNIIANTKQRKKDPTGTGYGVINDLPETHAIMLDNNCLYNNYAGNYLNCTSNTDIYVDPAHLNQNIGAGYFSEERPESINQTVINSILTRRCS